MFSFWIVEKLDVIKHILPSQLAGGIQYEQLVEEGYTGSCSPVYQFTKGLKSDQLSSGKALYHLPFKLGDTVQFDWSEEHVVLGGVEQKIKVAHFRLCHSRKTFVVAYPNESSGDGA